MAAGIDVAHAAPAQAPAQHIGIVYQVAGLKRVCAIVGKGGCSHTRGLGFVVIELHRCTGW